MLSSDLPLQVLRRLGGRPLETTRTCWGCGAVGECLAEEKAHKYRMALYFIKFAVMAGTQMP